MSQALDTVDEQLRLQRAIPAREKALKEIYLCRMVSATIRDWDMGKDKAEIIRQAQKDRDAAIKEFLDLMKGIPQPTVYKQDETGAWVKQRVELLPGIYADQSEAPYYIPAHEPGEQPESVWPEPRVNNGQYGPQVSTVVPSGFFGAARR